MHEIPLARALQYQHALLVANGADVVWSVADEEELAENMGLLSNLVNAPSFDSGEFL